jgi:hypothetical protein
MSRIEELKSTLDDLLGGLIGQRLVSVVYRTVDGERTSGDVAEGVGWIGGEVQIAFESSPAVIVGWGENDGWSDHFSLAIRADSTFNPGTLVPFPANEAPEWSKHVGSVLVSARSSGSNMTPHVLVLTFTTGSIVLADGYRTEIGDGDDVIILPLERCDLSQMSEQLWSAGAP